MKTVKKKILFISGTRADFGKLKPLMEKVEMSDEFEAHIFATGMHMFAHYGYTVNEIKKSGFKNIFMYINQNKSNSEMDIALANTIQGIHLYINEFPPDLIVVHGDRVEALAGAISGALNNILVAHIEGGEVSGTIDEVIRHAVSKLSHIHFVSNGDACKRLIQMGEKEDTIFTIGSPDIDVMLSDELPSLFEAQRKYEFSFSNYGIFMYHPVTTESHLLKHHIKETVAALKACGWNFIVIYPNNDPGSDIIYEAIQELNDNPHFHIFPSIRLEYFLTLLKYAKVIIGNSSAGIHEAPVYGVPTINIGTRQKDRFSYPSIINVKDDREAILQTLNNLPKGVTPSRNLGQGNSAQMFMEQLYDSKIWEISCQKQFQDIF